ncbi:MAG: hypothetical protein IPP77_10500 [Bacteroidetes bacterium]|nr:hypothetical protein [Bacteroidota bacterium]
MNTIQFLKRKEIDEQKWNHLIHHAQTTLPYALTWYLDAVAENWDALVFGDYQVVFPLPWFRKWGAKCIYQPFFCQQLGFFHSDVLHEQAAQDCLNYTKKKFPYIDLNLNSSTRILLDKFPFKSKNNFLISLRNDYKTLSKNYSVNHQRNIKKAVKLNLSLIEVDADNFVPFYLQQIQKRQSDFKLKHGNVFRLLTDALIKSNKGKIIAVKNRENEIISGSLFIFYRDRIINIAQATDTEGRDSGAAHFLFDGIIRQHAGSDKILDFEGSSIPSIARFYKGFGAEAEIFYQYKTNVLKRIGFTTE